MTTESTGVDREKVARIIDPEAWDMSYGMWSRDEAQAAALSKADAILALLPTGEAGEGGSWVLVPREPDAATVARIILYQVAHNEPTADDYARVGAVLELLPPTGHPDGPKVVAETFRDYRAMVSSSPGVGGNLPPDEPQ